MSGRDRHSLFQAIQAMSETTVEIRAATMDDLDQLVVQWIDLAAGQREYGSHLRTESNRTRISELFARRIAQDEAWIARSGDRIVGFVTFTMTGSTFAKSVSRGVIQNLYVVPEARGEGVGTQLLDVAERVLAEDGADAIVLEAMVDNDSARQFYRARGYHPHQVTLEKPVESDTS